MCHTMKKRGLLIADYMYYMYVKYLLYGLCCLWTFFSNVLSIFVSFYDHKNLDIVHENWKKVR